MCFSYFGAKTKVIEHYPRPDHDKVIEPFAGSARYAIKYFYLDVLIVDLYPAVCSAWEWIIRATMKEIRALPELKVGQRLDNIKYMEEGVRNLLGFTINPGSASPRNQLTSRGRTNIFRLKNHLLSVCGKFSHWKVKCGHYNSISNQEASWYIDPPYQNQGQHYVFDSSEIDYGHLGKWCRARKGQVIVCEGEGADWLPFRPMLTIRKDTMRPDKKKKEGTHYHEVIWHRRTKKEGFGLNVEDE